MDKATAIAVAKIAGGDLALGTVTGAAVYSQSGSIKLASVAFISTVAAIVAKQLVPNALIGFQASQVKSNA